MKKRRGTPNQSTAVMTTLPGKQHPLVTVSARSYEPGFREPMHIHPEQGQLKWPSVGAASVRTVRGVFVVPRTRAVWIPPGERHGGIYPVSVLERSAYIRSDLCTALPSQACVVDMSRRLCETLVGELDSGGGAYEEPEQRLRRDRHVVGVLLEEISDAGFPPLDIDLPTGSRLQPAVDTLIVTPQDDTTIEEWAKRLGMSARTFARTFQHETGVTFGIWRKRMRLLAALERLALGQSVGTVAQALGYESPSAFTYMFRQTLNTTPKRYFRTTPAPFPYPSRPTWLTTR